MEMNRKIRLGMVGGGKGAFIGAVHRHAALLDGHYELVCGTFSRDEENNQQTGQALQLAQERVYSSWQKMLEAESMLPEHERMEVVSVVTPNHLHVSVAKQALDLGFHVFCEKPLAVNLDEANSLSSSLAASKKLFGLAHTYLGYPMVWQARQMVAAGKLGKIRKVFVEYPQGWLTDKQEDQNKQASWRTDPAQAGASGCMGDIGTHAFGLVEFVLSQRVSELCAQLNTHVPGRRLDDDGAALIRTEKGASGVLIASQVCAGEENNLNIRVYGDKGGLEWRQMSPNSLTFRPIDAPFQVYRAGGGQPGLCDEAAARCRTPGGHPEGYLEAMANLYTDFARAVVAGKQGKAPGVPGLEDGLRGMAFIETMLSSSASDTKWHPVPDSNGVNI